SLGGRARAAGTDSLVCMFNASTIRGKGILLLVGTIVCGSVAQAFIYDVTLLKKWDASRGRYQKVLAYSDFHDQPTVVTQQAHVTQAAYIESFLKKLKKQNSKIIVEDLCAVNDRGCACCANFCVKPRGGILGGLSDKCQAAGVAVCNVEFRFCRVTSLGPVFNAPSADPGSFDSTKMITVGALRDEIAGTIREIQAYRDGNFLQNVYQQGIAAVNKQMQEFALGRESALSVARYVGTHMAQARTKVEALKKLLTFDSELLDHKILHQIVTSGDKELVVIFAGGSHCANVCGVLQKMGYARERSEPQRHEYLGAGVPKPLNLALLTF
ncbi:hypothetical protein, partial [Methylicorpusculum sp.]|uniref:hypothetical protein n=1 Tax=Methylicorpusculum sp. TaxID=2713644 RepID=UPI002AB8E53C